jgi:hypothetical protein
LAWKDYEVVQPPELDTPVKLHSKHVRTRLLDWLTVDDLVNILKRPDCVDAERKEVLDALGKRAKRKFKGLWDAVAWLCQHYPEIDLASPPRRPGRINRATVDFNQAAPTASAAQ